MKRRSEAGSAAVELAILAPVLVILLLLVVTLGRVVSARQRVDDAAADAARAASWASSAPAAAAAARSAAGRDLAGSHLTCSPYTVSVDTTRFAAGGVVVVHLSCTASLAGLSLLRLPGSASLASTSAAPIDTYRSLAQG